MLPSCPLPTSRKPTFHRTIRFAGHGTSSIPNCGRGLKKSRGPTGWRGTLPYRKKISPKTLAQSRQKRAARRAISQQFGNSVPAPRNRNQARPKVSITGEKCACREYNTRSRVLCAVVDRVAAASSRACLAAIENRGGVHVAQNRYGYRRRWSGWTRHQLLPDSGRSRTCRVGTSASGGKCVAKSTLGLVHASNAEFPGTDARSRIQRRRSLWIHVSGRSHRVLRQLYRALSLICALRSRSVQRRKGRRQICRTYKREEL